MSIQGRRSRQGDVDGAIVGQSTQGRPWQRPWILLAALIGLLLVVVRIASHLPVYRVGDGTEYYALFEAWRHGHRPFMTAAGWDAYAALYKTDVIAYLVNPDALAASFPSLVLGGTADMNHFWFYSFAASMVSIVAAMLHISLSPHTSFVTLHCFLIGISIVIAWKRFQWVGVAAVTVLYVLSPAIWYVNKVHTEFFTISLTVSAVVLFSAQRYVASALFLALASTQNISFAAISAAVLGLDVLRRRLTAPYSLLEAAMLCATCLIVLLHPCYYFFRFGFLTPQLVVGGASIGANLSLFYLWFIDPDLGLFPNWPLGLLIAGCFMVLRLHRGAPRIDTPGVLSQRSEWFIFLAVYLLVSLFAQSSTQNLNSGATPGLARYAVWYLALFFPMLTFIFQWAAKSVRVEQAPGQWRRFAGVSTLVLAPTLIAAAVYTFFFFRPTLTEAGAFEPSWMSALVQQYVPGLYDPPVEVFAERYGGVGETQPLNETFAIVGNDCRKVLLLDRPNVQGILGSNRCGFTENRFRTTLASVRTGPTRFIRLTDAQMSESRLHLRQNEWYSLAPASDAIAALASGWDRSEGWGVWSIAQEPEVLIPCEEHAAGPSSLMLRFHGFVLDKHPKIHVSFSTRTSKVEMDYSLSDNSVDKVARLPLGSGDCKDGSALVRVKIDEAVSPTALAIGNDNRVLGIGLVGIQVAAP